MELLQKSDRSVLAPRDPSIICITIHYVHIGITDV